MKKEKVQSTIKDFIGSNPTLVRIGMTEFDEIVIIEVHVKDTDGSERYNRFSSYCTAENHDELWEMIKGFNKET